MFVWFLTYLIRTCLMNNLHIYSDPCSIRKGHQRQTCWFNPPELQNQILFADKDHGWAGSAPITGAKSLQIPNFQAPLRLQKEDLNSSVRPAPPTFTMSRLQPTIPPLCHWFFLCWKRMTDLGLGTLCCTNPTQSNPSLHFCVAICFPQRWNKRYGSTEKELHKTFQAHW